MEDVSKLPIPPIYIASDAPTSSDPDMAHTQNVLLKAMADGVTDPKELARLAQLKKTADVYTVIDKLSLRKEFNAALTRAGLTLDLIVGRLKNVIENKDDEVAVKGITIALKSLGLEKAEETAVQGQAWEDAVLAHANALETTETSPGKYEVKQPEMPEALRKRKEEDRESGKQLYT